MRPMLYAFDDRIPRRVKMHMDYIQLQVLTESYLLLYFALEELAELSDGEIRLLTALALEEPFVEPDEEATSPMPSDYVDRVRILLLNPRSRKDIVSEIHLSYGG